MRSANKQNWINDKLQAPQSIIIDSNVYHSFRIEIDDSLRLKNTSSLCSNIHSISHPIQYVHRTRDWNISHHPPPLLSSHTIANNKQAQIFTDYVKIGQRITKPLFSTTKCRRKNLLPFFFAHLIRSNTTQMIVFCNELFRLLFVCLFSLCLASDINHKDE